MELEAEKNLNVINKSPIKFPEFHSISLII